MAIPFHRRSGTVTIACLDLLLRRPLGALVWAGIADADQTIAWLEKAFVSKDSLLRDLRVDPSLDALRSDPRFADLVRRMGFP
ncbi:MAG: TPR end-of-group domain-containing protein, partial [bacterium]